jgi:predicted transposase/invertase (TIGR01784 family)
LLLKYGHNPQLYEKLPAFLKMVDEQRFSSDSAEFLESVLHYLGSVVDKSRADEVVKEVRQSLKGGDIIMATMADKWFQQGIEQGREQQKIETARKLILAGMNNENVKNILELEISKIEEVRNTLNSNEDE